MNSRNRLKTAEHVSLGMSFVGLAIAGVTQQFMFALAPLWLNLSIGKIRQQKLEQESTQRTQEIISLRNKIPSTESLTYQDLDKVAQNLQLLTSNITTRVDEIDRQTPSPQRIERLIQTRVDELLDPQLKLLELDIVTRIDRLDRRILSSEGIERSIEAKIDKSVDSLEQRLYQRQFETLERIRPKKYNYSLISGRKDSRNVFLHALIESESRIILVCPWLTEHGIDREAQRLIIAALDRGVAIDIGWGNFKDVDNNRSRLSRSELLKSDDWKYNAIPWLDEVQAEHSSRLTLKVLGTHEKFLVCDRKFAMIGSHNYLTSSGISNERELGIKTDSPEIINELIDLFNVDPRGVDWQGSNLTSRNKPLQIHQKH